MLGKEGTKRSGNLPKLRAQSSEAGICAESKAESLPLATVLYCFSMGSEAAGALQFIIYPPTDSPLNTHTVARSQEQLIIALTLLLSLHLAHFAHTCLGSKALQLGTPDLEIFSKVKS